MTVADAYLICRQIARSEAKNFYYAFLVLPRPKRDAMCAVYAFMRKADDLADDESLSLPQRRVMMDQWLQNWRSGEQEDAVFVALRDAQQRFKIPNQLLEQLVQGTAMDLDPRRDLQAVQTYSNFDELYQYCYLVASVVGLVCIRIFGYSDPRAEQLAEETGIAFQLTNILRDVGEDVERDRVYLPLDLLGSFGVEVERLRELAAGTPLGVAERSALFALIEKAEGYYTSAQKLLPLIDADSRAALWVLVTIYHALLQKIAASGGDVFSERISVTAAQKLWILGLGGMQTLRNRLESRT